MARIGDRAGEAEIAPTQVWTTRVRSTLGSVLQQQADRHADAAFLVFERKPGELETTTWRRQTERSRRTAAALHALGITRGARVGVHLTNCPEFYDLWFGAAMLGAAIVPTNPLSTVDELGYIVEHAECTLVVTQPDLHETVTRAGVKTVVGIGSDWLGAAPDDMDLPAVEPTDVAGVLYTSGTTSRPKGVLVTHAGYLNVGDVVANHLRMRPDDRQLAVLPLFHGNAQYYSSMSALVTGASIALTPSFSASRWSTQAHTMGATLASLFAAPMRMILAQAESPADRAHALRAIVYAQSLSAEQSTAFERRFGVPIVQLYGMTETVVPPLINPLYENRDPASMGRPVAGARLRIVDESGADVVPGQPGQLLVAGEPGTTTMVGYLGNPQATEEALVDGWLYTGDVARVSTTGFFYFVDRKKDMIKRAGENVSCSEVEAVINAHPGVFECAVVGVPDEMRDEALRAFVVRRAGSDIDSNDVLAYCREKLSRFKVPDAVEFVESLPRTSVGKIRKHVLRDAATSNAAATDEQPAEA